MNRVARISFVLGFCLIIATVSSQDGSTSKYSRLKSVKESSVPIAEFLANPIKFAISNREPSAELLELFEPLKDTSAEDFSRILLLLMENPIVHRRVIENPQNFRKILEIVLEDPQILSAVLQKSSIFVLVFTHNSEDLSAIVKLVKGDLTWIKVVFENPAFLLRLYKDPSTFEKFQKLVQGNDLRIKDTLKKNPDLI